LGASEDLRHHWHGLWPVRIRTQSSSCLQRGGTLAEGKLGQ
jgi:hypothetical protein